MSGDVKMPNLLPTRRRLRLLANVAGVILGLGHGAALLAQTSPLPLPYAGSWLLDDPAAPSNAATRLTIDGARLSLRGRDRSQPACVQDFVQQKEKPGTVYANGQGKRFVASASGSFPTFLLKIGTSTCGGAVDHVRISFPLPYNKDQMEFIDYAQGKPLSARRFHRKK